MRIHRHHVINAFIATAIIFGIAQGAKTAFHSTVDAILYR